ncbi:hypothetical protein BLNAU_11089 [Blattamonas nauphoetae]|uniref:Uncharacterized protein n=1 Tax=Blattamonas nauphoetae TaxID=2049346 RepID=A0ABQ9XR69_9EUKA|nr:hypothetical protein BLNAU_11089 [Blattamonas nauphoetae]
MDSFVGTIGILSRQSRSTIATLSFTTTLALLHSGRQSVDGWMDGGDWWEFVMMRLDLQNRLTRSLRILDLPRSSADPSDDDSE